MDIWQEEKRKTTEKNQGFSKGGDGVTQEEIWEHLCVPVYCVDSHLHNTQEDTGTNMQTRQCHNRVVF